jgi:hypothetical protein
VTQNAIEGRLKNSDDRGIANLGHHARHHVVEIVAVKRPAAGIVGIKEKAVWLDRAPADTNNNTAGAATRR